MCIRDRCHVTAKCVSLLRVPACTLAATPVDAEQRLPGKHMSFSAIVVDKGVKKRSSGLV